MNHPVEHLRFPEAAVEPGAKIPQVAGQMFGTDAVVDTSNIAFHIGDQGMDPGQDLGRFFASAIIEARSQSSRLARMSATLGTRRPIDILIAWSRNREKF